MFGQIQDLLTFILNSQRGMGLSVAFMLPLHATILDTARFLFGFLVFLGLAWKLSHQAVSFRQVFLPWVALVLLCVVFLVPTEVTPQQVRDHYETVYYGGASNSNSSIQNLPAIGGPQSSQGAQEISWAAWKIERWINAFMSLFFEAAQTAKDDMAGGTSLTFMYDSFNMDYIAKGLENPDIQRNVAAYYSYCGDFPSIHEQRVNQYENPNTANPSGSIALPPTPISDKVWRAVGLKSTGGLGVYTTDTQATVSYSRFSSKDLNAGKGDFEYQGNPGDFSLVNTSEFKSALAFLDNHTPAGEDMAPNDGFRIPTRAQLQYEMGISDTQPSQTYYEWGDVPFEALTADEVVSTDDYDQFKASTCKDMWEVATLSMRVYFNALSASSYQSVTSQTSGADPDQSSGLLGGQKYRAFLLLHASRSEGGTMERVTSVNDMETSSASQLMNFAEGTVAGIWTEIQNLQLVYWVPVMVGSIGLLVGLTFALFPLGIISLIIPGQEKTLPLLIKTLVFLKLTAFFAFLIISVGGVATDLINQMMEANLHRAAVAAPYLGPLALALNLLVAVGTMALSPMAAYMITFQESRQLSSLTAGFGLSSMVRTVAGAGIAGRYLKSSAAGRAGAYAGKWLGNRAVGGLGSATKSTPNPHRQSSRPPSRGPSFGPGGGSSSVPSRAPSGGAPGGVGAGSGGSDSLPSSAPQGSRRTDSTSGSPAHQAPEAQAGSGSSAPPQGAGPTESPGSELRTSNSAPASAPSEGTSSSASGSHLPPSRAPSAGVTSSSSPGGAGSGRSPGQAPSSSPGGTGSGHSPGAAPSSSPGATGGHRAPSSSPHEGQQGGSNNPPSRSPGAPRRSRHDDPTKGPSNE